MADRLDKHGLQVDPQLATFIETQALPGTGVAVDAFWAGFSALVHDLGPKNRMLLAKRAEIQGQVDDWHIARKGQAHDAVAYQAFLREIGYLVPEGDAFEIKTANVDPEIASVPGPQLVVPITNARFALNAANEVAVSRFLDQTIKFGDIMKCNAYIIDSLYPQLPPYALKTVEDIEKLDHTVRQESENFIRARCVV